MTIKLTCRLCNDRDIDQAIDIIKSHTRMHGQDITYIQDKFIQAFLLKDEWHASFCLVNEQDEVLGVLRSTFSENLPIWFIDFAFYKQPEDDKNYNSDWRDWTSVCFNAMIDLAEEKCRYEFYYAIRDQDNKRLALLLEVNHHLRERYEVCDVEVLKPGEVSKYATFGMLRKILDAKARKTTVIRHCHLKKEFRPNVWNR
jgi:hypothetical protein